IVWLRGSPGTGKSAICKTVASTLHDQGKLAGSFFFDKRGGSGGMSTVDLFISTLIFQLASSSPEFRMTLGKRLASDSLLAEASPTSQLHKLLLEAAREVAFPPSCVIVIDALDEC
ncbi:hypothetical protein DL93DRAFT_2041373, partial [Clavulina sp. PMI_390]